MDELTPIPGYEEIYSITRDGRIWSHPRWKKPHGGWLKPCPKKQDGYLRVCLSKNSHQTVHMVHRLVWKTFRGDIPEGIEVDHIDHDQHNNHLDNLQLLSRRENAKKMWSGPNRPSRSGEGNSQARLTVDQVLEIRKLSRLGASQKELREKFGASKDMIYSVIRERTWKNVCVL